MAKTAAKQNLPARTPDKRRSVGGTGGGVPAFLEEDVEMSGAGVATSSDDLLIPMARILQKGSPECERKAAAYLPGAEAGKILIRGAPRPIVDGAAGFLFQLCYRDRAIVEWVPRNKGGGGGKGFRGRHPSMPKDAVEAPDPQNPKRSITISKTTGNVYVDTRYCAGFIIPENADEEEAPLQAVLPMTGSNHSVARAWNTLTSHKRTSTGKADIWSVYYRLTTLFAEGDGFTWYKYLVEDAGPLEEGIHETFWVPTMDDYRRGEALYKAISSGAQKFGVEDDGEDDGKAGDDPDDHPAGRRM